MIDAKFRFYKDYITLDNHKFKYSEPKLQQHFKAIEFLQKPFDAFTKEEIYDFTKLHLNTLEQEIVDRATLYVGDIFNLDEYDFKNKLFWWADYEYLEEEFFEEIYEMTKDIYNDMKDVIEDKISHIYYRFLIDVLKYKKDRFDIMHNLYNDWDNSTEMHDIVIEEYEDNLYFNIINDNKIHKVLRCFDDYIQQHILYKEEIKKLKKKEKKRILKILSSIDNINNLRYDRLYYETGTHSRNPIIKQNKKQDNKIKVCYILKNKRNNLYKIGNSKNPLGRESTLQSQEPELESIKIFKNNWESVLHEKYKKQRVRGEWFNLSNIQVKYICTHFE